MPLDSPRYADVFALICDAAYFRFAATPPLFRLRRYTLIFYAAYAMMLSHCYCCSLLAMLCFHAAIRCIRHRRRLPMRVTLLRRVTCDIRAMRRVAYAPRYVTTYAGCHAIITYACYIVDIFIRCRCCLLRRAMRRWLRDAMSYVAMMPLIALPLMPLPDAPTPPHAAAMMLHMRASLFAILRFDVLHGASPTPRIYMPPCDA